MRAGIRIASAVAILASLSLTHAKVVRTSAYPNAQAALDACVEGDVFLLDGGEASALKNPPDNLQIVGGSSSWELTGVHTGLVFFDHNPRITQTAGLLRRCLFTDLSFPSKFVGLDSCMFIGIKPSHVCSPCIEIDGFVRYVTITFTGYMGTSMMGLGPAQIVHRSSVVINATDPAGDGSGTLVANIVSHSQGDWTPVHVVNGRRVTIAHINSEYTEWADPYVKIENGVECAVIQMTPGGRTGDWRTGRIVNMADGTLGYAQLSSRNGLWAVGGQANMSIGGCSYVSFRSMVTTWTLTDIALRDPYFQRWNAYRVDGVNLAPSIRDFGFGSLELGGIGQGSNDQAFVMSSAERCSTTFIDETGAVRTSGLRGKPLPAGPSMPRPFMDFLPDLKLDTDGPGTNYTGRTGAEIQAALNGNQRIYLGPGTYAIPGTINRGIVYGAGRDKTILKFPAGVRCMETGSSAFNLTIEGGKVGWAQTTNWRATDGNVMNVRFRGQSLAGVTLGNAQQNYVAFCDFEDCNVGINACADDIVCGEDGTPGGSSMIDKVNVYCCRFKNLTGGGINLGIGNNGYTSAMGCRFENCGVGYRTVRTRGANGKCEGHYATACDFVNCGTAINLEGASSVHNCTVQGGVGFTGNLQAVVSCSFSGAEPAVTAPEWCVVSHCTADGSLSKAATTWVGASKFSNLDASNGAYVGTTNLSQWVTTDEYEPDQTPPTAPTNVRAVDSGADKVVTWGPSSDAESGVLEYIIMRNGARVGRTNHNFVAAPHHRMLPPEGPGVYRNKTSFVDIGQGGKDNQYTVVAVNCARIRSDDVMDMIYMFPYNRFPMPKDSEFYKSLAPTDSVEVPLGMPVIPGINRPFMAYRFPKRTSTGVVQGPRHTGRQQRSAQAAAGGPVGVYDLRGRLVATVVPGRVDNWKKWAGGIVAGTGIYLTRMPDGRTRTLRGVRP